MTISVYQVGDLARVTGVFTNPAETEIDPTGLSFFYTTPAGVTTELVHGTDAALVKDSVGNYHVDVDVTEAGEWHYRWESTGTGQAGQNGQFMVEPSSFVSNVSSPEE